MKMSISVSEVCAADRVVFSKHVRRSFHHDASGLEEKHVVGEVQSERRVLFDEQNTDSRLVDRLEDPEDLTHNEGRQTQGTLDVEYQARAQNERARYRQHLLLAA